MSEYISIYNIYSIYCAFRAYDKNHQINFKLSNKLFWSTDEGFDVVNQQRKKSSPGVPKNGKKGHCGFGFWMPFWLKTFWILKCTHLHAPYPLVWSFRLYFFSWKWKSGAVKRMKREAAYAAVQSFRNLQPLTF